MDCKWGKETWLNGSRESAIVNKRITLSHNEECRKTRKNIVESTADGNERNKSAVDNESDWHAEKVKRRPTGVVQARTRQSAEGDQDDSLKRTSFHRGGNKATSRR